MIELLNFYWTEIYPLQDFVTENITSHIDADLHFRFSRMYEFFDKTETRTNFPNAFRIGKVKSNWRLAIIAKLNVHDND